MAYKTQLTEGRFMITLVNEPEYCHALGQAPAVMEPEMSVGLWLVLNYAVWSEYDLQAIDVALSVAKRFGGRLNVGLRPFESHAEVARWCPESNARFASPIWLILNDGKLVNELAGPQTADAIADVLAGCVQLGPP